MDKVVEFDQSDRAELFQATADQMGMSPAAVEKDFWACWVLKKIYEHQTLSKQLLFKGGTSLSKCFNLIERFSEDIDLILDWQLITDEDPYADRSNTKQNEFNKAIDAKAQAYVAGPLFDNLTEAFGGIGELVSGDQTARELFFRYPQSFDSSYIRPEVLIEVGPMSAMAPSRDKVISTYASQQFPNVFDAPDINIRTIEARKTFWDKITILHVEAHRSAERTQPARYSRHYYDVFQMLNSWVKKDAMSDIALLKSVAAFKNKFYPQGWANYQGILDGTVNLMPMEHTMANLSRDYQSMKEMIHGAYPGFEEIMDAIKQFEIELNEALN